MKAVLALALLAGAQASCDLAAPDSGGGPVWVQTGAVFHLYSTDGAPRQLVGAETEVDEGSYYVLLCSASGWSADHSCVATCKDGKIDYDTYCRGRPEKVCLEDKDTWMVKNCPLDFLSDDEWGNTGMSLKEHWFKAIDLWYYNPEPMFESAAQFETSPTGSKMPVFPHNLANLVYMGLGYELFGNHWNYDELGQFDNTAVNYPEYLTWETFNLAVYSPWSSKFPGYVADPLGSTTDGPRFFPDAFGSFPAMITGTSAQQSVYAATKPMPREWDMRPTYLAVVAMEYDPCDKDGDAVFMGLPKGCFHIHQSGPHTGNGNMAPFYKPLKDGTLDFSGVCNSEKFGPAEYEAAWPMMYATGSDDAITMAETLKGVGGYMLSHTRTWGLHFCIDWDLTDVDPYAPGALFNPFPCTLPSTAPSWPHGALGDFMILDPLSFVGDPVQWEDEYCEKAQEGLCDWMIQDGDVPVELLTVGAYPEANVLDAKALHDGPMYNQITKCASTDTDKDGMCVQPHVVMGMAHDVCFGPAGVIETDAAAEETGWAHHTPYNAKFIGCEEKDGKLYLKNGVYHILDTHCQGPPNAINWIPQGEVEYDAFSDSINHASVMNPTSADPVCQGSDWENIAFKYGQDAYDEPEFGVLPMSMIPFPGLLYSMFGVGPEPYKIFPVPDTRFAEVPTDSAAWHKKGDESKDCEWVRKFMPQRCSVVGEDNTLASESCQDACSASESMCESLINKVVNGFAAWEYGYGDVWKAAVSDDLHFEAGAGDPPFIGPEDAWEFRRSTSRGGFPWNILSPNYDAQGDNEFVYRLQSSDARCNPSTKFVEINMLGIMKMGFDSHALSIMMIPEAPVLKTGDVMQMSRWKYYFNDENKIKFAEQYIEWNVAIAALAGGNWYPAH
jgi:hypothetical protein